MSTTKPPFPEALRKKLRWVREALWGHNLATPFSGPIVGGRSIKLSMGYRTKDHPNLLKDLETARKAVRGIPGVEVKLTHSFRGPQMPSFNVAVRVFEANVVRGSNVQRKM